MGCAFEKYVAPYNLGKILFTNLLKYVIISVYMEVWINMDKMNVYHGSTQIVASPDLLHSRNKIDFGKGLYTTEDKFMAKKMGGQR